jgi:predicted ATPase
MLLSLDGLDGSGKSTQLVRLAELLHASGHAVTTCADPGGTDLGAKVREILLFGRQTAMSLRAEALLFMASRAELVERVIAPALARGVAGDTMADTIDRRIADHLPLFATPPNPQKDVLRPMLPRGERWEDSTANVTSSPPWV